ncbi:MAG: hypothetical protein ACI8UX_002131 [Psychromonas sp.]|jgi:hypothetical protein
MFKELKKYRILILLFLIQSCSSEDRSVNERAIKDVTFFEFDHSVDTIMAGEAYSLKVNRSSEAVITNSWGNYFIQTTQVDGHQILKLSDSLTSQAGLIKIIFLAEGKMSSPKTIIVKPFPVAEPLESYIGSKSIEADGGQSWSMITAIPQDNYFNFAENGTSVIFNYAKPTGAFVRKNVKTGYGVAYDILYSGRKIGKTKIGAIVGEISGKEKELIEIAGAPVDFLIETKVVYPTADSRQNFLVKTEILKDRFKNTVADGTLVNFYIKDVEGDQRKVSAYTLDGIAKLKLRNPTLAGQLSIQAEVGNTAVSKKIVLSFKKFITKLPLLCDGASLKVGPLIGSLNQYVSDGSEVELTIYPDNFYRILPVKDGYASFDFINIPNGLKRFEVRFGGISKTLICVNE